MNIKLYTFLSFILGEVDTSYLRSSLSFTIHPNPFITLIENIMDGQSSFPCSLLWTSCSWLIIPHCQHFKSTMQCWRLNHHVAEIHLESESHRSLKTERIFYYIYIGYNCIVNIHFWGENLRLEILSDLSSVIQLVTSYSSEF